MDSKLLMLTMRYTVQHDAIGCDAINGDTTCTALYISLLVACTKAACCDRHDIVIRVVAYTSVIH
jgi:hypothetical protein